MDETLRLSGPVTVYSTLTVRNGKKWSSFVRSEQSTVVFMKHPVNKFQKPGELVIYMLYGILATAQACLNFLRYLLCVDSKVDTDCAAASLKNLAETHARQILNKESGTCGSDKAVDLLAQAFNPFRTR